MLSDDLKPLGLEVHLVPGPEGTDDSTRFLLRFRDPPTLTEAETAGFRIDDLAVLAATIALVNSKQGRISRKELESFLKGKFPRWRIDYSIDRYIKRGYLDQDEKDLIRIGWRTRAEIRREVADDLDTRARHSVGRQEVEPPQGSGNFKLVTLIPITPTSTGTNGV